MDNPYQIQLVHDILPRPLLLPRPLYDRHGKLIYHISEAILIAEIEYGSDWDLLTNGQAILWREELRECVC